MTEIPTELMMALVEVLDVIPPILEDWIRTTGYGEVNRRDKAALAVVKRAVELHQQFCYTTPGFAEASKLVASLLQTQDAGNYLRWFDSLRV